MKAELEYISNELMDSFLVKFVERPERLDFKSVYHYHPEYELIWTIKSSGRRFIGNHISEYKPDELVFLGKNIPHCWITPEPSKQMVIQMKEDFLGIDFLNTPECLALKNMLQESYRGLQFFGETKVRTQQKLALLPKKKSFQRLLLLLEILNDLANSTEFEYLSTDTFNTTSNRKEVNRIQTIYNYIHQNYRKQVTLDEAISQVNLSKSAFCKFIKRRTNKTFSQIVNQIRLQKACDLLIETDKPIMEICYAVGYNDPSYFFKVFQKETGFSPKQFRLNYD
ncbi:MAG: AraC family transcriptional regulator [Saprospiraceae bacterium]